MNLSAAIGNPDLIRRTECGRTGIDCINVEVRQDLLSIPISEKDGNSIRNTRKEHFKIITPGINLSAAIGKSTRNTIQCVAKQEPTSLGESASGFIKSDPPLLFSWTPKRGRKI
ncbi:hypothetical protein CDAR_433741 [Caerostris darwini]|uniref:Uncharacterized protein n=1 Tax=Caerostris darwini TaxID=1538125 RepID=A0AAV4NQA5_9ARAC|nr:hypothetical protein CDAR_433741 [Caerostris darwini]